MSHCLMLIAAASLPEDKVEQCQELCRRLAAVVSEEVCVTLADDGQRAEVQGALSMAGGAVDEQVISPEGEG